MPLDELTPSEYERMFADIAPKRPDAILVHDIGDLLNYRQLIVELVNKIRLPAMYGAREFIEAGGLMAYQADQGEAGRRLADDVHQILNRANPGDIPIYQAAKFAFVVNLKAAKAPAKFTPSMSVRKASLSSPGGGSQYPEAVNFERAWPGRSCTKPSPANRTGRRSTKCQPRRPRCG